jgi:hypothetical protein
MGVQEVIVATPALDVIGRQDICDIQARTFDHAAVVDRQLADDASFPVVLEGAAKSLAANFRPRPHVQAIASEEAI